MPLAFFLAGTILAIAALRNTHKELGALIAGDFTGAGNFGYWIAAIAIIGSLGYLPHFSTPSRALMALIILALLVSNQGFFAQLQSAIGEAQAIATAIPAETKDPAAPTINVNIGGGAGAGAAGGALGGVVKGLGGIVTEGVTGLIGGLF